MKKLYFHWEGHQNVPAPQLAEFKAKTKRRARRYFKGQTVRHRVVSKSDMMITFGFRRRSGSPVTIRWRLVSKSLGTSPSGHAFKACSPAPKSETRYEEHTPSKGKLRKPERSPKLVKARTPKNAKNPA